MRRKSERNKVRSPEKKVERPSRRTRRRRGTPESDDDPHSETEAPQTSQQDDKKQPEVITKNPSTDSKESNSNSDEENKEQSVWQVKSAETPSDTGEIQKLKICLQRPSSIERSPRKHHGSSQESADSSEDIRKKRSKRHHPAEQVVETSAKTEPNEEAVSSEVVDNTQPEPQKEVIKKEVQTEESASIDVEPKTLIDDVKAEAVLNNDEEQPSSDISQVSNHESECASNSTEPSEVQIKEETHNDSVNNIASVNIEKVVTNEEKEVTKKQIEVVVEKETIEIVKNEINEESVGTANVDSKKDEATVVETAVSETPLVETPVVPVEEPSVVMPVETKTEPVLVEKAEPVDKIDVTKEKEKSPEPVRPRRTSRFEPRSPQKTETEDKNGETLERMNSNESSSTNAETEKVTRKRRWGSKRTISTDKKPVLAITTDSLKNLISDVKPLSVNDVQLDVRNEISQPDIVKNEVKSVENKDNVMDTDKLDQSEKDYEADEPHSDHASEHSVEVEKKRARSHKSESDRNERRTDDNRSRRKISSNENVPVKQTSAQPKNKPSEILYITNLVRPFTVLQLKGLLARTGKLVENGFWIDNIKSKCFVHFENEDQAVETRHALHGTRWPASNPKLLQVEFSTVEDMEKCVNSVPPPPPVDTTRRTIDNDRVAIAWLTEQNFKDEKIRDRDALRDKKQSVREWDMGKQDPSVESPEKYPRDIPVEYPREAISRERREDRYDGRGGDKRRSRSRSPVRRFKRKEEEAPAKRLDDLFRKTKVTPCIYWLPLTPEQISVKEEMRRQHMAEHERRKEEIRKQERERERERHSHREKQNSSNREQRRRNDSHHNSRSGDRNNH